MTTNYYTAAVAHEEDFVRPVSGPASPSRVFEFYSSQIPRNHLFSNGLKASFKNTLIPVELLWVILGKMTSMVRRAPPWPPIKATLTVWGPEGRISLLVGRTISISYQAQATLSIRACMYC